MAAKLFLGGISPNTTTEDVQAHFAHYGNVIDAIVMYKDGKHRGFGFVTFDDPESIALVLAEEQVMDGRVIDVKEAVPQGEAPPPRAGAGPPQFGLPPRLSYPTIRPTRSAAYLGREKGQPPAGYAGYAGFAALPPPRRDPGCDKVFIGGLAQTTTEDMVQAYFSMYGNIIDCVVMKDRGTNKSRGFGFVQFDNTESVDHIIDDYANHELNGKWVEVKKAVPQDRMGFGPAGGQPFGRGGCGKGGPPFFSGRGSSYPPPAWRPFAGPPPGRMGFRSRPY